MIRRTERTVSCVYPPSSEDISLLGFRAFIRYIRVTFGIQDMRSFFQGKKLLDAGCGIGSDVARFKDLGADAFGLDLHPIPNEDHIIQGDVTRMPFGNDEFDIVFCKFFIDQLSPSDFAEFIKESFRVLKPGGFLFIFNSIDESNVETILRFEEKMRFAPHFPPQQGDTTTRLQKPVASAVLKNL